jgi:ribosomal protein S18 acetylase RimI-like enzyme
MKIRPLTRADDLDAAGEVVRRAYFSLPGYVRDEEYDVVIGDVASRIDSTTVLVAMDGERVVGCLTFVAHHDGEHAEHGDPHAASFRYFGVDPEAQGRGVGRHMVEWVVAESRRLGKQRVFIHTIPCMQAAMRLYEGLGFVRAPEHDERWGDVEGWAYVLAL